jgi:hypothetical protein
MLVMLLTGFLTTRNGQRVGVLLFLKNILRGCMTDDREKAMIYILSFFKNRMAAVNKHNVSQVKELISTHEIAVSELVDKYVELVYENS